MSGAEYIGEFEEHYYRIVVDGYMIPNIKARKLVGEYWELVLDERYTITVTGNDIQTWIWWVANAMAIAAGYTSFGENAQPANPYKTRMYGLSLDELEEIKNEQRTNSAL